MRVEELLPASGATMDKLLNLRFLIAAGVVLIPLAYLIVSTMQHDQGQG